MSEPTREQLLAVFEAARGLVHGMDWNNGAMALVHGYRQKLVEACIAIEPDLDLVARWPTNALCDKKLSAPPPSPRGRNHE